MSSSDPGRLRVSADLPGARLTVRDATFREVASGVGMLDEQLSPGIYQVEVLVGGNGNAELFELPAGGDLQVGLRADFPAAAPVSGSSTSRETHMAAAAEASGRVAAASGPPAGLVVLVRNLRGDEMAFAQPELRLVDADGAVVPLDAAQTAYEPDGGFASWALRLEPGGYALSFGGAGVEQSVWLEPGWQTLVFVPNAPAGPAPDRASVHMAEISNSWEPHGDGVSTALDLALASLRQRQALSAKDLDRVLLGAKFMNPMLGLVGAHSLLLRRDLDDADRDLLVIVADNLAQLVPGHPDAVAVSWSIQEVTGRPATGHDVAWPPMLRASYEALVRYSSDSPDVLREGSFAELVAGYQRVRGLWTAWDDTCWDQFAALQVEPPPAPPPAPGAASPRHERAALRRFRRSVQPPEDRSEHVRPEQPRSAATRRVAAFLEEVAALEEPASPSGFLSGLDPRAVAAQTGLPLRSVNRALADLGEAGRHGLF